MDGSQLVGVDKGLLPFTHPLCHVYLIEYKWVHGLLVCSEGYSRAELICRQFDKGSWAG